MQGHRAMTKKEIARDIAQVCGTQFPSISHIARYMGMSRATVRRDIVKDIEYVELGRSKRYFAGDIAARIMEMRLWP